MRKGLLKSVAALLAGAGLAAAPAWAGGQIARVSFEDADKASTSDGKIIAKPASPQPIVVDQGGSYSQPMVEGGGEEGGTGGRFWLSGEALLWWLKGDHAPALIATGPFSGGGILAPGTGATVLFGGRTMEDDPQWGFRITAGYWLDCDRTLGVEVSGFWLPKDTDTKSFTGTGAAGTPVLARPFINANTGLPDAELNAAPGLLSATKTVRATSELSGFESNGLCNICCGCNGRVDALIGGRYLDLEEHLSINENVTVLPGIPAGLGFPFIAGNRISATDEFSTRNQFYGGQLGIQAELRRGRFFADLIAKCALGWTHETVDIGGVTTITTPAGAATQLRGGLLALSTNIGRRTRDQFAVVPEGTLNVGYQVTDHLRAFVGYDFLYWSEVVRPGGQIDTTINPTFAPTSVPFGAAPTGPARPAFAWHSSDFWAQGFNFGIQLDY